MNKIVFLDRGTLAPQIRLRPPAFAHALVAYERTAPDQVAERIREADIVITNKVPIAAQALAQAPGVRLIAVAATGTDCVDKAACKARGVVVSNIRGYAVNTVPEHVFALIFALRRSIVAYRESVLAGRWQESGQFCFFDHSIHDLAGSRLGIIGRGVLGQRVAEIAKALGMIPQFAARKGASGADAGYVPWDEMLATSDVITLHLPLTEQSRGLIAMPEFRKMQRRPIIINTARGGLVDEADLVRALDAGLISGAGFDVTQGEPPALDNPLMRAAARPNLILTPHVAWASDQAQQALADQLIDNIERFVAGNPVNLVGAY
ncbi:D-2-hydroxyacid dehydrogenase [Bordetella sp. FB-8]|uniref:D-2-hydroxyacid dehydrogenase n=1 Tax=Bordetella sp. FB-8 TaxID=1159870 RepID=UPI0003A3B34F|nr:D-2-hydroxyacid dehydrogenase [Bordetella sp. FB-8]